MLLAFFLVLATQVFSYQTATAAEGSLVRYDKETSSGCLIQQFDPRSLVRSGCSGTLVSPTEIMTAAHCVTDLTPDALIEIQCGYHLLSQAEIQKKIAGTGRGYVHVPQFQEKAQIASIEISSHYIPGIISSIQSDFAIIYLKSPLTQTPISSAYLFLLDSPFVGPDLRPEAICKMIGFGGNSIEFTGFPTLTYLSGPNLTFEGDRVVWRETLTLTHPDDIQFVRDHCDAGGVCLARDKTISHFLRKKGLQFVSLPGDSGAGLLCRNSPQEDWMMTAVMVWVRLKARWINADLVEVLIESSGGWLGDWTRRPMRTIWE